MATQNTKIIDVTKTYIPLDPRAFPENYHATYKEDYPEQRKDVVPYEGYNFLPTSYGYKSYFGTETELGINALESRVDEVFIIQTNTFQNIAVALCEDGIWTKDAGEIGAWEQVIELEIPEEGFHLDWTYCLIGDQLFCYRAQGDAYYTLSGRIVYFTNGQVAAPANIISVVFTAETGGLPAGTYDYQVAYFNVNGELSLPTPVSSITNASAGKNAITFPKETLAVNGYRIYRTTMGVTTYLDESQPTGAGDVTVLDTNLVTFSTEVTLPDLSLIEDKAAYEFYAVTPNFLNMIGQQGIFKAGSRLGFWDTENSIAWSSIDDFADFTPSITTLAGSAIFNEVSGRIVQILANGDGFMIYSTKSVLLILRNEQATFQWDPFVIIKNAGIAFKGECCAAVSDTMQFAYTSVGLYKFEKNNPEIIITEVTDFLKESNAPVYLRILEGRYLFLQIIDPAYIDGLVGFRTNEVPALIYRFPGAESTTDDIEDVNLVGNSLCATGNNLFDGLYGNQQADGAAAAAAAGQLPAMTDTFYKPNWTCFLSSAAVPTAEDITWVNTPCSVTDFPSSTYPMSPQTLGLQERPPTIGVAGEDAYIDGNWTLERFIATQTAIWDIERQKTEEYLNALASRSFSDTLVNETTTDNIAGTVSCTPIPTSIVVCEIGELITNWRQPYFEVGRCSFSMTRQSLGSQKLITVIRDGTTCTSSNIEYATVGGLSGAVANSVSPQQMCENIRQYRISQGILTQTAGVAQTFNGTGSDAGKINGGCAGAAPIAVSASPTTASFRAQKTVTSTRTVSASNRLVSSNAPGQEDTAECKIVSWTYTNNLGVEVTVPASTCHSPTPTRPLSPPGFYPGDANNGSICGIPFEPITLPAIQDEPITWQPQQVVIPPSSFLLQAGSIGPIYPTFYGALVYDLQLKKWGKMKAQYKALIDWSPLNNLAGNNIPYEVFGMQGGIMKDTGVISIFDKIPLESYIKYGKIGYFRQGFTSAEEIRVSFRSPSTGTIQTESSINGSTAETSLDTASAFTDTTEHISYPHIRARWHNISINGIYDIKHIEFRGNVVGNR